MDALNELHIAFNEADAGKLSYLFNAHYIPLLELIIKDGSGTLELDEFKEVVRGALKIQGRVFFIFTSSSINYPKLNSFNCKE